MELSPSRGAFSAASDTGTCPTDSVPDPIDLRYQVKTTHGNLGSHMRKLDDAGYVEVEKEFVERTTCRRSDPSAPKSWTSPL